jgi:predicted metal-dependent peptidase
MLAPTTNEALDYPALNRELDKVKSAVFLGKTAAFLGSIMCSLEFIWSEQIGTAGTDGIRLYWNPHFFLRVSRTANQFVLMHELWHVAKLHMLRGTNFDPEDWNKACDHNINLLLKDEGYNLDVGFELCVDDQYRSMAEEEIYAAIQAQPKMMQMPFNSFGEGGGDLVPMTAEEKTQVVNTVVTAVHQAKMSGAGNVPGNIEEILDKFLAPVIKWQILLQRWFTQHIDEDYTWARPNRRFQDIYLPSRFLEGGRLENLAYYLDVSGSITSHDILRFGSELKFVKEQFNPGKITVVQFDTMIQRRDVWTEDDPFEKIEIKGRGGTRLDCVRRDILEEKPTAAIIFSDMQCRPMEPLGIDIPIIWIVTGNGGHVPAYGEVIHIRE